jgi:hypothetical protein
MEPTTKRTRTSRRRRTKHQDRGSATGEPARPSGHGGAKGAISRPPTLIGHAEIRSICCNTWVRPLQGTRCFLLLSLVGDAPPLIGGRCSLLDAPSVIFWSRARVLLLLCRVVSCCAGVFTVSIRNAMHNNSVQLHATVCTSSSSYTITNHIFSHA